MNRISFAHFSIAGMSFIQLVRVPYAANIVRYRIAGKTGDGIIKRKFRRVAQ